LGAVSLKGETMERIGFGKKFLKVEQDRRWIINVGSVGQPRDEDPHARYVLFDSAKRELRVRAVTYDISATKAKIRLAGLPDFNAERLGYPDWD
jgi:diadenosine tetraphosphatase ApaH/serine/threonine PP2A family protein phosphatase